MIDTIVLTIPQNKYSILDHNRFNPSTKGLFESPYYELGSRNNFRCTQNPTKKEILQGIYKPRLTIAKLIRKGHFEIPLRIEFSIPKLIYGNNFDEINETDFELVLDILQKKLNDMAIKIDKKDLQNAEVSAIHFSKNIPLVDYSTCTMVIDEISKINLTKRMDLNRTSFTNEGQIIHYHCNSFEIVIYDKIKDLKQSTLSEKRSIELDNFIQQNILKNLKINKSLEILRIEIRLNTRRKIKQVFQSIDIINDLKFINLFSSNTSKKVIAYFWEDIYKHIDLLSIDPRSPFNLLEEVINDNTGIKLTKALRLVSSILIIQEKGFRPFRNLLTSNGMKNTYWYSLVKELEKLNISGKLKYKAISEVSKSIKNFVSLRLKDYI